MDKKDFEKILKNTFKENNPTLKIPKKNLNNTNNKKKIKSGGRMMLNNPKDTPKKDN